MKGFIGLVLILTTILLRSVSAQEGLQCDYATDIDQDDDGLIELCDLDAFNAVRYQLDGSGYRESFDAIKITAGCPQSGCNGYELRNNLDFNSEDSYRNIANKEAWTSGLGWLPIGNRLNFFTARFEGNGHTIANLYINRPSDYVGLFKATTRRAKISNLVLSQINIKGNSYIGSLAGHNAGGISYIGVEGGRLIGAGNNVGGLLGSNEGTILNGDVILERVESSGHSLGGLIGYNEGNIRYSVTDTSLSGVSQVGGLVGLNFDGVLTDSRTDGSIKGRDYIGGLVGLNRARISASHAKAKVISEGSYSGGLVGANHQGGRIADSRASGAVSGNLYVGGLVGWNNDSEITNSFTVNRIEGNSNVGGLVGWNEEGQIHNTYSSGFVSGVHRVGGLVGSNKGIVSNSFANGRVVASGEHAGGLIAWNYAHQTRHTAIVRVIHSYWDSDAAGILVSDGGSLRTTAQLKLPTTPGSLGETFERWDADDWEFGTSEQHPVLRHSEGSSKGHLLPGQHIMLSGLLVLDGLTFSPSFNPQTFNYRVNLIDDSIRQIRFSPTIANSTQTISVLKDEETSLPSVRNGETVPITLNVSPEPTLITIARHYRIWVIRQSGLDATITSDRSDYRVSEGERITLDVSTSEPDLRRVRYQWRQIAPTQPNLLEDLNTRQAQLSIDISNDFVAQDVDETLVILQAEVRAGGTIAVRNTTMTVIKTDSGSISTLAAPSHRQGTLITADISEADLSMEPDGGVDLSSLRYQWQYKPLPDSAIWQDIEDATEMRYKISTVFSAVDNISYRVLLDYRDNQGHDHRVVSEPLLLMTVEEDDGFSDIYYLEDLDAIRNRLNSQYELVRDLDFNADASYRNPINKTKWTVADYEDSTDTGWLPIGKAVDIGCNDSRSSCFNGTFEGNGHTILNLQINRDAADYQGLFGGLASTATVRHIGLAYVKIEGNQYIGGLAGSNEGAIAASYVVGELHSLEDEGSQGSVGGLAGNNLGLIINSHAHGSFSGVRYYVGGLVGRNDLNARIINSFASGDLTGNSNVGGLVGSNRGPISNSYATGSVIGEIESGGLVGTNALPKVMIANSYAIGRVEGSGGGLVARDGGGISASYWNTETSGLQGRHGSGQTTQQMQLPTSAIGIYEEWDDVNWDFGNGEQYPILKYTPGANGDGCGLPRLPQCGELISPRLRYGLRNLATVGGGALSTEFTLSPEFNIEEQNHSGIYIGTLSSTDSTIRFIPTTIEPTARISFYIGDDESTHDRIRSGETSKAISLQENSIQRIHMEVQGTQTVRYTLHIDYQNIAVREFALINYLEDLRAIHQQPSGFYKLARDLDFADRESYLDPLNRIFWTVDDYDDDSDIGWVPIGNEAKPFTGSFDGNGYTISGLQINKDDADNQSLFGVTSSDALIRNIGLLNVRIEGGAKVAGLVGTNRGQVGYSYVSGSVQSKSGDTAGGLVANNAGGNIIGSYAISEVSGTSLLGGLVGDNGGRIINSHADGLIMPVSGISRFGGLVGRNQSLIANSYATGKILASGGSTIGGLVGSNDSQAQVMNSYASVNIEGFLAGGLVGYNEGSIKNSYASGELNNKGGTEGSLVGDNFGGTIVASYWNADTIASGGNHGIEQNTQQLQSGTSQSSDASKVYYKWSDSDWHFGDTDQYPILKHTTATESVLECGSLKTLRCGDLISPGFRYGLRGLRPTNDVSLHPPIAIEKFNQSGIYFGTVIGDHPSVRLIPVAMEPTARISIIGTMREILDSHDMSAPISLKNDQAKKVVIEVGGTQRVRYTLYLDYSSHRVIDEDGDGLVDINYLEDLDAIRHQLDGSGYRADAQSIKVTSGCPNEGCKGYELLRDLDFNDSSSYRNADANMRRWTDAGVWRPIGRNFIGTFNGNNKTIANLRVRGGGGLFVAIGSDSRATYIDGIGLPGVDITGNVAAGIATSCMQCTISNSYVIGNIEGNIAAAGLINTISASSGDPVRISNSYFIGNLVVEGQPAVGGGLVGDVDSHTIISNSYVVGTITAQHTDGFIGSLIGARTSSAIDISYSYASVLATKAGMPQGLFGGNRNANDRTVPAVRTSYLDQDIAKTEVTSGVPMTTMSLQSPTNATGIYTSWGGDNLGNSANWDFGTDEHYPAIKYNLRGDFTDSDAHCEAVDIQKRPMACSSLLRHQGSFLQSLKLSEGAGLSSPFAFALFDYDILVNADRSTIRLLPTASNANATVEVFKDGSSVEVNDSGEWTLPIPLNDSGNTVVNLVIKDDKRDSYRYQFIVNRLSTVVQSIDQDGDGLIEIHDAMDLNVIRNRLDGSAYQKDETTDVIYCPDGCIGYELTADIDLAGVDWQPIGDFGKSFNGVFKGNGHTISNLTINTDNNYAGLFGVVGTYGRVENVGLVNINIAGQNNIGSIAGYNAGTIINSYANGKLLANSDNGGGLVGINNGGMIVNSYTSVDVRVNNTFAGGLVGWNQNGSIVNSYAIGDVYASNGNAGGLVGNHHAKIHNSYATGDVQTSSGSAGGLVAATILGHAVVNSYYRKDAVISRAVSLVGTSTTSVALKAGIPSGDIYTEWDRVDWHFGNVKQYPVLLYATGDDENTICKQPSLEQLSDCNNRLFAGLSGHDEHDKRVICRSHLPKLPREMPYCGALLPGQRANLAQIEFSENARLIPVFNPEVYDYHLVVDTSSRDGAFRTTSIAYYDSHMITVNASGLSSSMRGRQSSSHALSDDLDSIVITVRSATRSVPTFYTLHVVQDIAVIDGFIPIDYLEDLNLMHYPLEQVSAALKDCPIDTKDDVRRCKGYKLSRDLDFESPTSYRSGVINPAWTAGAGWQPIGDSSNPFRDLFNGNAHTIANLRINDAATDNIGLFGVLATNARIENVGLLAADVDAIVNVRGQSNSGALVGTNNGEIINSYVISGEVRGNLYSGGLVGRNEGVIINSHASVKVTGASFVGGLVGGNQSSSSIYNSYATGMVSGNYYVGGLVGVSSTNIEDSYTTGAVSGGSFVGGLVGWASGSIINGYASGNISGSSQGLIGGIWDTFSATQSYWDVDTSKVIDDENDTNGVGKMTTDLQTAVIGAGIYSNWSSSDWHSGSSSQYPTLRYTSATDVITRPACRAADDILSEMPVCGTLLPVQRPSGLRNLALSTSQILLLNPDFDSKIYNYELILRNDTREFSISPRAFNSNAVIVIDDDGKTNLRKELRSGQVTTLITGNTDSFLLTLTVEDPLVSETTEMTHYRVVIIKHPFIAVDDIDEDDDGLIEIRSADDLNAIRYQLDGSGYRAGRSDTKITVGCPTTPNVGCKGYELAASIDLSDYDWHPLGAIDTTTLDCGDAQSQCFTAIFDGNRALGYEISGLRISSKGDNIGLFAALADSAQVRNVNLSDIEIAGSKGVGTLAAYNAGEIDNSYANGMVAGERAVAGLVAYNIGRISNSYVYGIVSGGPSVGGLVARNENNGVIANSYSLSRVLGNNNIGGLVGLNLGAIANTYASGSIQGATLVGGLVGSNSGSVRNSYATADVVCTGVPMCASYAVATGGLIGNNAGGVAVNSYWDIATSNLRGSAAGIGKTTLQLQSSNSQSLDASRAYYQWSDSDWHFGNAQQYPILKYTSTTESTLTGLQSYGLSSLAISQVVTLSPHFNTSKLHYRIGVELDANIEHLHLIPQALDEDAIIRIASDNGFDETVKSATSSSSIALRSTTTTLISIEVSGDQRVRYHFEVDYFSSGARNVDTDKDGLIEILTLEDLDAMRNALDGSRLRHQSDDGVLIENAKGCPTTGCKGYELLRDLDFDNPAHYRAGSVNSAWTTGAGWQPIGTLKHPFVATLKGNGYTISNLRINRPDSDGGLFGVIDGRETDVAIEELGLIDVDIVGGAHVGGLVAHNQAGNINRSYVSGYVEAKGNGTSAIVGGLVGWNVAGSITESYSETQVKGNLSNRLTMALAGGLVAINDTMVSDNRARIVNSYTIGSVVGRDRVGGLVALNRSSSEIINSYAVSRIIAIGAMSKAGGLVARNDATVSASHWDIEVSGVASSAGGTSATTIILQSSMPSTPTSLINSSVYRNWDTNVWEFADANSYPVLKAVKNARLLVPEGKSLLQSLTLSGVRPFPSFHPLIFNYELITESAQITEVRLHATSTRTDTTIGIACSDGLVCASSVPLSFVLNGSDTPQITITTHNPDSGELSYNFSIRYVESEIRRVTTTTTTDVLSSLTVAEGERVRLIASNNFDFNDALNEDLSRYSWRQSVGDVLKFNDVLSPVDTQSAILDFTVPADVVLGQADSRSIPLIIEVAVNDGVYLSKTLPLIISRRNNDTAHRVRLVADNNKAYTYIIRFEREDGSEFVDQDGGFAATHIQWQRRLNDTEAWVNVGDGSPTLPNEGDYQYRAIITHEDNQGYRQQFESEVIDYLDIDDDGDGLIEIRYLEELDAIRHQPNGSGFRTTASAVKITAGCPLVNGIEKCRGYELVRDLDFSQDESYRTANPSLLKDSWTVSDFLDASDSGWQPINRLNAVFNGNGYTISNIQINRSVGNQNHIGLFSVIGSRGRIENLGLIDAAIKGLIGIKNVGSIAGSTERGSEIINSYVVGDVASGNTDKIIRGDVGFANGRGFIGGLVGWNKGFILNSYAKINVIAEDSGMASNKRVGVGGLVGRNIDGGKVYNSYATGEVKGPCIVGGLVGNQFSTNSGELLKRSEIKNSYATGNVETGFGPCVNANNQVAGGLVSVNSDSTIENSYAIGKVSGVGTLSGLVGRLPNGNAIENPVNSYWRFGANCNDGFILNSENDMIPVVYCYGNRDTPATLDVNVRLGSNLQTPTMPNVNDRACIRDNGTLFNCQTYVDWDTADWDFGTNKQYPAIKYGIGLNTSDPGCVESSTGDPQIELPSCDALLPGQTIDALLLNNLSLSFNSREVRLTPSFGANRFDYDALIDYEILPVVIRVIAAADDGIGITIRKDDGLPLTKQSDGSVRISASRSFNLRVETASGDNRGANYQVYVRLPQLNIFKVVNGSTPTELITTNISALDEGDVFRLDASASVGTNKRGLNYRWTQVSGTPLLSEIQTTSILKLMVPADFVARDENHTTVILKLELSESGNPAFFVSREIPLSVRKVDNGNFGGAVKWINSDTLYADDLSNDADGESLTDIDYRWLREQNGKFIEIPGADQKSYTPPEDVRNAQYRFSISYVDGQGYQTNIHYDAPLYADIATHRDKDNDGLIEIETLEDLNAIRYQLNGSGYRASSTASKITVGCPADQCIGYELVRDLDFLDNASYVSTRNKVVWTSAIGWQPIGTITTSGCSDSDSDCFRSIFDGNGHSISNLRINKETINDVGLFTGNAGTIRNLGLSAVEVTGSSRVGGLVGRNEGQLINVYVIDGKVVGKSNITGLLTGANISNSLIRNSYVHGAVVSLRRTGGICGINDGNISNSYAAGSVSISQRERSAGGLVGVLWAGGKVSNSYSTAEVKLASKMQSGNGIQYVGGLIGRRVSSELVVANSYWDIDTSGQVNSPGGGTSKTTAQLQMPTDETAATGIYADWSSDDWDFGTPEQYPALKYYDNTCDTLTPSPDCGKLLLYQRVGLSDLRVEQNVGTGHLPLSPDFSSTATEYTVSVHADASELRITPIVTNPDASIVADGKILPANHSGYIIALNTSTLTFTIIQVAANSMRGVEDPVVYKLTVNNRLPQININAPSSINEGETFALNALVKDPEGDELSYSLTMTPDLNICRGVLVCLPVISTGTAVGRASLMYELDMPNDLLTEMQSIDVVDIVLTVEDRWGVISEKTQLTIVKENNDVISIPTPALNGFTYTIGDVDLSSDSDGVNLFPNIAYQWQKELLGSWSDINGATDASYTVDGIVGDRYRVLIGYTDEQGYRHQRVASPSVSAPQQFVYDIVRSRDVIRTSIDRASGIFIHIRVLLEGLLR